MNDLTAPRRQHIAGLLVRLGWQARHMLRAAWPVWIAASVQDANDAKYFLWAISVGAVFTSWAPCFTLAVHLQCKWG